MEIFSVEKAPERRNYDTTDDVQPKNLPIITEIICDVVTFAVPSAGFEGITGRDEI